MTTPIQIVTAAATGTSLSIAFTTQNVTPGNTLVLCVYSQTSAATSVVESLSEAVNTRIARGGGSTTSFAVYDVLGSAGNTKVGFTISVASSQKITAILAEYAAALASSFDQATVIATGSGEAPTSASLSPSVAGELAIGCLCITNNFNDATWDNNYVAEAFIRTTGQSSPTLFLGDQVLVGSPAIVAEAALTESVTWSIAQLLYKAVSPISGGATSSTAGTGLLSTGIKLAATASDATTASGVIAGFLLPQAMSDVATASGALSTAIKLAAAATATGAPVGALTNYASVVLVAPLYTGAGGIFDPSATWSNGAPAAGNTVFYDGTNLTIETDGEILAPSNDPYGTGLGFSALCQWDNGGTWSFLLLEISPWPGGEAVSTTNGLGSLTGAILFAAAAQAATNATGQLATSGGGAFAGAASDSSSAAGGLNTQIQLAGAIQTTSTAIASLATAIEAAANAIDDTSLTAALDDESLVAPASDSSAGSGLLATQIQMLGAAVSLTSAIAALATSIRAAAAASDSSAAGGALTTGIDAAGAATVTSTGQGVLTVTVPFNAAAAAATVSAGAMTTAIRAVANAVSTASAQAALATLVKLVSAAQAGSAGAAAILTGVRMVAAAQAASQAIAALTTQPRTQIAGAATSSSSAISPLTTKQPVSGAAAAGSTGAAVLSTGVELAGQPTAGSAGAGNLFTALDPDANAVTESSAIATLGNEGSTLFTADVLIQATPDWLVTSYGAQEPVGQFPQRIGDKLIYAIDWTGWLSAYWKPNVLVVIGDVIRPWPFNGFQFRCVAPGTTGGTPPAFPAYLGAEVLDGEAQWECVPLDDTSLTANLASAVWSAPAGIVVTNQRLSGLLASALIDTTQASPYTNYDVQCLAVASDGRQRAPKLTIAVTGGVPN